MKTKWFGLTVCLLATATSLQGGDDVQLDKNFSFHLTQPEPSPSAAPTPFLPAKPTFKRGVPAPLTTPDGVPLPPGTRVFQFNGAPYYYIPL